MIIRDPNRTPLIIPTRRQNALQSLDQLKGEKHCAIYDTDYVGDTLVARHVQWTEPIQQYCEDIRKFTDNGMFEGRGGQYAACVPGVLWLKWQSQYGDDFHIDEKLFSRLMNSEEGKPYKIARNA